MMLARTTKLLFAGAALAIAMPTCTLGAQTRTARVVSGDGVQRAIVAALAEARKQGWNVSIAVVDVSGELLGFHRMDNAPPASVDISQAKARTAARLKRTTGSLDSTLTAGRTALLALPGIVPVEGGVPIMLNGEIVGAIGVSGATAVQDAQVARAGASVIQP